MKKKKTIIVVGYARQTQTAHQIQCFLDLGVEVINIDPHGIDGCYGSLCWQGNQVSWKGHDISPDKIDAVLVCAHAPDYPQQQVFEQNAEQSLNWAEWFQNFGLQRDRSDTLLGLLLAYERAGVKLFNPPSGSLTSRRKPYQISVLQSMQCQMPATLVSNDPETATAFIQANGDCIVKPAAGGSLTLSANELLTTGRLDNLSQAPAIIQQRIYGDDLRVIVVGDKVVSAVAIDVPENTIDFRGDSQYQTGRVSYRAVELPTQVEQQCINAVSALGLKYSGIDIKHTEDDQYYFLECNSSPIYLDVENKMQHKITEHLCRALMLE
ncbi:MAG: ATP-grasp domain-containing protein [Thiolinea sp.]